MITWLTVAIANICCNPKRQQKFVNARMKRAAAAGEVVFGQEIEIVRYWRAWKRLMAARGKSSRGIGHEVPISLPWQLWKIHTAYVVRVHGGLKHVSPARYFTVVIATRITGERVIFINLHPPSKWYKRIATHAAWRRAHGQLYWDRVSREVTAGRGKGWSVVVGGDCNHPNPPQLHPAQHQLVHSGLDHLWVVPGPGVHLEVGHSSKIPRTAVMDHPILTGRFALTKEASK